MALAWVLWPIVLLGSVLAQATRRVLMRWRLIILWLGLSFACWPPLLLVMWLFARNTSFTDPVAAFAFTVRWWNRVRALGVARVLPDGWTHRPPLIWGYKLGDPEIVRGAPSFGDMLNAYLHVALALSLTLTTAVVAVLFIRAIVASIEQAIIPFDEEVRA